ncbi:MAG: hypothetical protein JWN44_991 [Myxococcales bacterium]|nr:hypothetical protein [Myxococcales bacterium]
MTLAAHERRWATVIAGALIPPGALGGRLAGIDVGARYAAECARSPWHAALLLRATLYIAWLAPIFLYGRLRTFGSLDALGQASLLERLLAHRVYVLRMAAMFLKLTLCTLVLGDEPTLKQIGAYRLTG